MPTKSKSGLIRKVIGPCKARLHGLVTMGEDLLAEAEAGPTDDHLRSRLIAKIETAIAKVEAAVTTLTEQQKQWQKLVEGLPDDEVEAEEAVYDLFVAADDDFVTVMGDAREQINVLKVTMKQLSQVAGGNGEEARQEPAATGGKPGQGKSTAKLPKLILPEFHGDHLLWSQFWAIFQNNIGNSDLKGIEKLTYLRGQLKGVALAAVEGLEITNDSYEVAVKILRERFERSQEQIIGSLYSQLIRLPRSANSLKDLQRTYDACERIFRQLRSAGEDIDANRSLVMDLLSKYPHDILKEVSRRDGVIGTHSKVSEVQTAFHSYIDECTNLAGVLGNLEPFATRQAQPTQGVSNRSDHRPSYHSTTPAHQPTGGSYQAKGSPSTQWTQHKPPSSSFSAVDKGMSSARGPPRPCYFCKGGHYNIACDRFPTLAERNKQLTVVGRCGKCLSSTHTTAGCLNMQRLRCNLCGTIGQHIAPLCPTHFGSTAAAAMRPKTATHLVGADAVAMERTEATAPRSNAVALCLEEQSVLATAVTTISNPETGSIRQVRILLDNGSHRSYITERLARQLQLRSEASETLEVAVFGTERSISMTSHTVRYNIGLRGGQSMSIKGNTTVLITTCSLTPRDLPGETARLIKSFGDDMADDFSANNGPPEVLIGSDLFWRFITGPSTTTGDGVDFIPSTLGYLLGGSYVGVPGSYSVKDCPVLLCLTERAHREVGPTVLTAISSESRATATVPDVDEFWQLETIGIADNPVEDDDTKAWKQFSDTVYFADGRYQVQLAWKPDTKHMLPTNERLARGRLLSTGRRLMKAESSLRKEYHNVIMQQLRAGIIELVPDEDKPPPTVHYLPHHPVVRVGHNTTKVRVVYDASAKCRKDQLSLNECLYRGPVILPALCEILIRFRLNEVALVADIEKAFLQIGLQPSERDVTRFFWFINPEDPEAGLITLRFTRVLFGAICSPFLLGGVIQRHLGAYGTATASAIGNNIYVDNVIAGADDADAGVAFCREAKDIFHAAGMNIREWCSNSSEVLAKLADVDRTPSRTVSVLGLKWVSDEDYIQLKTNWDNHVGCRTKREVLQATASVYDPLGLFQPVTQQAKCFLRDLWKANSAWDEPIDEQLRSRWNQLHADIKPIFSIKIPRKVKYTPSGDTTLVVFSDASIDTYAAAVYLRSRVAGEVHWHSELVFAKSRLCPRHPVKKDNISLPRLELLGLAIAAKAAEFVRNAILLHGVAKLDVFLLTDSTCVLGWIRSDKSLPVFVENRVKLLRVMHNAEFHHVAGDQNPADLATRGLTGTEISKSTLWWYGPDWLTQDTDRWPTQGTVPPVTGTELNTMEAARDAKQPVIQTLLVAEGSVEPKEYPLDIDPVAISTFQRLIRVSAWCLKFLKIKLWSKLSVETAERYPGLAKLFRNVTDDNVNTAGDLANAKTLWVQSVQRNYYDDVLTAIRREKQHQLVASLNLGLDEAGLLRCYGRLRHAELAFDAIQPALLAKMDRVTNMIIADCHVKLFHAGVTHTLAQLRREFWIPQGRQAVRKVITRCRQCRRLAGPPFALPAMPPWPKERVSRSVPFQFTGVDYFGPVSVTVNGVTHKMWVCLYTCLAVRAVHLEAVTDCTAQSFIECFSRFISRRGRPELMVSDNGPQFRLAATLLDQTWQGILTDPEVQSYVAGKGVGWKFITELAPWQGGFYERLVGVVKTTFRAVVGRKLLPWDQFATLITEVEAIVNSRPLTYVSSDIHSGITLRPMDFLTDLPTGVPSMDPTVRPEGGDAGKQLVRYWKSKQRRLDQLWRQWYDEYLLSMREKGGNLHRKGRSDLVSWPTVGEVVLIKSTDAPRGSWKLGRIVAVTAGSEGAIRAAEVRLPNRQVIRRPINHLYSLEVPGAVEEERPVVPTDHPVADVIQDDDGILDGQQQQRVPDNDDDGNGDGDGPFYGFRWRDLQPLVPTNLACNLGAGVRTMSASRIPLDLVCSTISGQLSGAVEGLFQ